MNRETTPVAVGLAVGVLLIVLFSIFSKPAFTMSDEDARQKARSLPEVQAFYERYTPLEQVWREGTATYVEYHIGKTWFYNNDPGEMHSELAKFLKLTVRFDSFGGTSMVLECLGPISSSGPATVEEIKSTSCIEEP